MQTYNVLYTVEKLFVQHFSFLLFMEMNEYAKHRDNNLCSEFCIAYNLLLFKAYTQVTLTDININPKTKLIYFDNDFDSL